MITYKWLDKNRLEKTTTKVDVIDIGELEKAKKALEAQLEQPVPSNEELIEEGRISHPYFVNQENIKAEVSILNNRIEEYKRL